MATTKDLVEAHSFSRRRLVTAFLSGAPGGREVEPARPGRTVVGGLALAILLVAGAAITSVLAPHTDEDWNKVGLVVSRQQAAPYVILKQQDHPTLIPVINITSAQLILGADLTPTYVDQSLIEAQTPGEPIGILGAPQTLPQPHQFINQGWTSCTGDGLGMSLDISHTEHTSAEPAAGVVVQAGGTYYLVAKSSDADPNRRAYAYPLPNTQTVDDLLLRLRLGNRSSALRVPEAWVWLFPAGGELGRDSFAIADWGKKLTGRGLPPGARVGDYVTEGNESVVLTEDGPSPLDPFALQVYVHSLWGPEGNRRPRQLDVRIPLTEGARTTYDGADWPSTALKPLHDQVCAQLSVHHGDVPRVELRGDPTSTARVADGTSSDAHHPAFAIDRGHGALVQVGDWDQAESGSVVVIDPSGYVYSLIGGDTLTKLGFDKVPEPLVPDSWVKLFTPGVALSSSLALCPPNPDNTPAPQQTCEAPPS